MSFLWQIDSFLAKSADIEIEGNNANVTDATKRFRLSGGLWAFSNATNSPADLGLLAE